MRAEALAVQRLCGALVGDLSPVRAVDTQARFGFKSAHRAVLWGPAYRQFQIQIGNSIEGARQRVENHHPQFILAQRPIDRGRQLAGCLDRQAAGNLLRLVEAVEHILVHPVDAATADGIVRVVLDQPAPGHIQETPRVWQP